MKGKIASIGIGIFVVVVILFFVIDSNKQDTTRTLTPLNVTPRYQSVTPSSSQPSTGSQPSTSSQPSSSSQPSTGTQSNTTNNYGYVNPYGNYGDSIPYVGPGDSGAIDPYSYDPYSFDPYSYDSYDNTFKECSYCGGEGENMCYACNGSGYIYGLDYKKLECNTCYGDGENICMPCGGTGGHY